MTVKRLKRKDGFLPMGDFMRDFTRTAFSKRGIHHFQIISQWHSIVGEKLSDLCCPLRITQCKGEKADGILTLQVLSGACLDLEFAKDQIMERINSYFGYQVVTRLKLIQTPSLTGQKPTQKPPVKKVNVTLKPALQKALNGIEHPELKEALTDFSHTFQQYKTE